MIVAESEQGRGVLGVIDGASPRGVETAEDADTCLKSGWSAKSRAPRGRWKLRDGLAPGGRVVIVDVIAKAPGERPWGPPPEQNMSREEVDAAMAEAAPARARTARYARIPELLDAGVHRRAGIPPWRNAGRARRRV